MLEFLRALRHGGDWAVRLPGLALAFLVAEVFYKFGSFALEGVAFLATWLVLDVVTDRLASLLRTRSTPDRR